MGVTCDTTCAHTHWTHCPAHTHTHTHTHARQPEPRWRAQSPEFSVATGFVWGRRRWGSRDTTAVETSAAAATALTSGSRRQRLFNCRRCCVWPPITIQQGSVWHSHSNSPTTETSYIRAVQLIHILIVISIIGSNDLQLYVFLNSLNVL